MISKASLLDILAEANEYQPELRQLPYKSIFTAAYRAELVAFGDDAQKELLAGFANFAVSSAHRSKNEFNRSCIDLLPDSHPAKNGELEGRLEWVENDPIFSTRQGLVSSAVKSSGVENTHAWARLYTLSSEGLVGRELLDTLSALELEILNGNG